MKTFSAKPADVTHEWFVIDATDKVLGRVASEVALRLRGKHKPIYTPFLDTGDFVVVLNAEKIKLSGKKAEKKVYKRFSGYPGGQKEVPFGEELAKHPEVVVLHAVKNMLPRGTLGRQQITKLKVYKGTAHPHQAQKPKPLEIK